MMMSGCGILTNGKGTRREYGDFNLDELQVKTIMEMLTENVKKSFKARLISNLRILKVALPKMPQW